MGLQGYVGNADDARRIRRQEKQREEQKKKFEAQKKQLDANVDSAGLRQFGAGVSEVLETAFKNETVGLVTREEFLNKRKTLKDRLEEEATKRKREAEDAAAEEKAEHQRRKARLAAKSKLSFADEEVEADDKEAEEAPAADEKAAALTKSSAPLGKNPEVATEFLPDRDREFAESRLREQLKKEYELRQQILRNEPLQITYSYWDGSGHRRQTTTRKGDTIGEFLHKVREQLAPEFRDLRATSVSSLMYVKEDLIIPHNVSFFDLITDKARGKSGPLFHFDVHEDIRMVNDASKEKDESHAGKVVDRHWYNRNKHIFPASRWEVYDPDKQFERYTIHGK